MKLKHKEEIQERLAKYVEQKGSQGIAAAILRDVSTATISQIINNNWNGVSADMWRSIGAQIGWAESSWNLVETSDFKFINMTLEDSQQHSNVYAITGDAGTGKSLALRTYAAENKNVMLIKCNEYFNRKYFMDEVLRSMGKGNSGLTTAELVREAVKQIERKQKPLIILDEADKLSDQVLYFFITLYNMLEDNCGIVLAATDHLERKIKKGIRNNKKGYKEIYSRIGRKFLELSGVTLADVIAICAANGVTEKGLVKKIYADCEGDLRRVKREIHKIQLREENTI